MPGEDEPQYRLSILKRASEMALRTIGAIAWTEPRSPSDTQTGHNQRDLGYEIGVERSLDGSYTVSMADLENSPIVQFPPSNVITPDQAEALSDLLADAKAKSQRYNRDD